jgi:hypothetical protein
MPSDEIKLIGPNSELTKPQKGSGNSCELYFDLSDVPSKDWEKAFQSHWNKEKAAFPFKSNKGTLVVVVSTMSNHLKVTCLWDDEHLADYRQAIERAIETANTAIRERNKLWGINEAARKEATQDALKRFMS